MARILIVEDDENITKMIEAALSIVGHTFASCADGKSAVDMILYGSYDLVLLDIMLPFFNGYHWCNEIRKCSNAPIIFLSSASDNMNIVMAMNMGGDDFIAKPFDRTVLVAKVQALLRRCYDFHPTAPVLEHRGAELNTGDNSLRFRGEKIELTKNEYRILLCLMENKGQVVSREKLMERLWASDSFVDENTLTVNVNRLRRKLDGAGLTGFITTKFGVGYLLGD